MSSPAASRGRGYAYALGAYTIWGLIPAYFKLLVGTPPLEVLAHRIVWAFVMLLPIGWHRDRLRELLRALGSPQTRLGLSASTVLIALNWLIYIWSVFHERIVEASLGYLAWAGASGTLAVRAGPEARDLLLVLAGPVTAIPLLLFAGAVAQLPLTSLGFLQYVSPSMQIQLAVLLYGEPFRAAQAGAFALIWLALLVFAAHTLRRGGAEPVMEPDA